MLFLERYIFFFLWLAAIKCNDINSIVNKVEIHNNREIEFNELKYNILFSPEKNQNNEIQMDKVNALYLILSCSFAEQAIFDICNLIVDVPSFYSHTFLNSDYKNVLIKNNWDILVLKLTQIETTTIQFITLYKNYLKKVLTPNLLYYNDNDILRIFGSLFIKIEIVLSNNSKSNHTDMVFIREILEEMNAIQIFLSMNCDKSDKSIENMYASKFYGYTAIKQTFIWRSNLYKIFKDLEDKRCSFQNIFLQDFIEKESMHPDLVHDISNSTVNIFNENGTDVKIKDFFKQIRSTYDINAIYWYMKSILATIMKLLFSRIIEGIQKMYLTLKITIEISNIIKFCESNEYIPVDLLEGFILLKNLKIQNRDEYDDENDDENEDVRLINKLYTFYSNIKPNISLVKYYNIELSDIQDMSSKDEDYDIKTLKNDKSEFQYYLNNFLDIIHTKLTDFKCFGEYLQYLENPINKQYLPSNILMPKQIKSIDKVEYRDECYFIMDIYYISFKSNIFVNKSKYQIINPNDSNESTLLKARNIINFIRDKFVMYLKLNKNNLKLFKVVKDIVIIIENLPMTKHILEMAFLKRIIYFINAKLNNWGLEYCSQPKFNFLLFDNIHLIKYQENDTEKIDFDNNNSFFKNFKNIIETNDYQCFRFQYLYTNFIEKPEIVNKYSNVIFFNWNNVKTSIGQVYSDLSNLFFKPHYLYIFYEIYFIFHIAAYYYNLRVIYYKDNVHKNQDEIKFDQDEYKSDKDRVICPEYLSGLFHEILILKKKLYEKNIDDDKFNEIKMKIEKFNIIFDFEGENNGKVKMILKTISLGNKIKDFEKKTKNIVQSMSELYIKCYEIIQFDYNKTSPTKRVMKLESKDTDVSTSGSEDDEAVSYYTKLLKKKPRS